MRTIITSAMLLASTAVLLLVMLLAADNNETTLTGILAEQDGVYSIDGTDLDFGPDRQLSATAPADYDGDDTLETLRAELDGLVGTTVTAKSLDPKQSLESKLEELWKQLQRGDVNWPPANDSFQVSTINGLTYRDPDLPPPWSGAPEPLATPGSAQQTPARTMA